MKAHMKRLGLLVAVALFALPGCGKDKVPEPKDPTEEEPMLDMPAPEPEGDDLEGKAGVIVTSSPEGVEILVDGKSVGTTPLTHEGLESGAHDVTFMFEGDGKMTLSVDLGPGEFKKVHQSVSPDASDAKMDE
jgi:hypothetical protein